MHGSSGLGGVNDWSHADPYLRRRRKCGEALEIGRKPYLHHGRRINKSLCCVLLSSPSWTHTCVVTSLCPKSLSMVASFLLLACWCCAIAGFGSRQSTERRWSHISASCWWSCFRLGSKQWTWHPDLPRKRSSHQSVTPSLQRRIHK